jgi:hypothetical protein
VLYTLEVNQVREEAILLKILKLSLRQSKLVRGREILLAIRKGKS